jgi:hypothetical protein
MAYSRLRDLRSVRHPSLVAYPWLVRSNLNLGHNACVSVVKGLLSRWTYRYQFNLKSQAMQGTDRVE